MQILRMPDEQTMGAEAARLGAGTIRQAIAERGSAVIIVATGASQFEVLSHLVREPDIDWQRVTAFHLDEYIGLPATHDASFRGYLQARLAAPLQDRVNFIPVQGDGADIDAEIQRLNGLIERESVDVCFAGIGENGHLAFNDPPADFDTPAPYIVVELDEACRRQQLGEGWFASLEDVPQRAISMSIRQIMKSRQLIISVPHARKADAVERALQGPVTPAHPASILQRHPHCSLLLDPAAASRLAPDHV